MPSIQTPPGMRLCQADGVGSAWTTCIVGLTDSRFVRLDRLLRCLNFDEVLGVIIQASGIGLPVLKFGAELSEPVDVGIPPRPPLRD